MDVPGPERSIRRFCRRGLGPGGWVLMLALFAGPAGVEAQHLPPDPDLELMLRFIVEDLGTPGIVLGVRDADGSTRAVTYGSGGAGTLPLGPRSIFEVGSLTKTFTATLLADMVLRGEVTLDDPLGNYLPDHVTVPAFGGRKITLLHLATHTSGLPGAPVNTATMRNRIPFVEPEAFTADDAYAFLATWRPTTEPGDRYGYSNFGYALLGHALGRAARSPYRTLVERRILLPLGMTSSGFAVEGDLATWMTRGHRNGREVANRTDDLEFWDASGGLRSNVHDLLLYLEAQVEPPASDLGQAIRMTHEIRVPTRSMTSGHALAWQIADSPEGDPLLSHGGGTPGFTTRFHVRPASGVGTVLLANQRPFEDDLAASLLLPGPPPPEWVEVEVPRDVLRRHVGSYAAEGEDADYFVRLEPEGILTYQPRGRARARLYATSDSTFHLLRGPWSFIFRAAGEGPSGEAPSGDPPSDPETPAEMVMQVDARGMGVTGHRRARRIAMETPSAAQVAGRVEPDPRGGPWMWLGLFAAVALTAVVALRRKG
jgi:serine-type D-Ala-D-Ala carboxypeptidase/endopeptidase